MRTSEDGPCETVSGEKGPLLWSNYFVSGLEKRRAVPDDGRQTLSRPGLRLGRMREKAIEQRGSSLGREECLSDRCRERIWFPRYSFGRSRSGIWHARRKAEETCRNCVRGVCSRRRNRRLACGRGLPESSGAVR